MLDPISLATTAVVLLSHYLPEAAKGAAGKVGEDCVFAMVIVGTLVHQNGTHTDALRVIIHPAF